MSFFPTNSTGFNWVDFTLNELPIYRKRESKQEPNQSSEEKEQIENQESTYEYVKQEDDYRKNTLDKSLWPLSMRLDEGRKETHALAVTNDFLKELIEGKHFCTKSYVYYLCNLYAMHKAIERAQAEIVKKYGEGFFVIPDLFRSEKLLHDIQIFSTLNPSAHLFADVDVASDKFKSNVLSVVGKKVQNFVSHIDEISKETPLHAIGAVYALYGTIMSGGQLVMKGVKNRFVNKLAKPDGMEPPSKLREKILENQETYIKECTSFFCFPLKKLLPHSESEEGSAKLLLEFKNFWHKNLDDVMDKLKFETKESKEDFIQVLIKETNFTIMTVLDGIEEMLYNLLREKETS